MTCTASRSANIITIQQAIQTTRNELSMAQKDLAQKINEKPSVIQDYESGKAVPSPQILGKLERTLKVKLRGMYHDMVHTICVDWSICVGSVPSESGTKPVSGDRGGVGGA